MKRTLLVFLLSSVLFGCSRTAASADEPSPGLAIRGEQGVMADDACLAGPATLCLHDGRFSLDVQWKDFENTSGLGTVVLNSEDSGLFWFFDANNWEMLTKVIDGCSFNGRFWVFSAATTNVEYTLRVTDHRAGQMKEYVNALGNAAPATTDTNALETCDPPLPLVLTANPAVVHRVEMESRIALEAWIADEETGAPIPNELVRFQTVPPLGTFAAVSVLTNSDGRATTTLTVTAADLEDIDPGGSFAIAVHVMPSGRLPSLAEVTISVVP